jgi:hypothetical protein
MTDKDIIDYIYLYAVTHHGMPPSLIDVSNYFDKAKSAMRTRLQHIAAREQLVPVTTASGVRYTSPKVAAAVGRLRP